MSKKTCSLTLFFVSPDKKYLNITKDYTIENSNTMLFNFPIYRDASHLLINKQYTDACVWCVYQNTISLITTQLKEAAAHLYIFASIT